MSFHKMRRRTLSILLILIGVVLFTLVENGLIGAVVFMIGMGLFISNLIGPPEDGKHRNRIKY